MKRFFRSALIFLLALGVALILLGSECPPPVPLTIEIAAPVADSIVCSESFPIEVTFSRAVNPAIATISALLVEGIDSAPVQTDISGLFAVTAMGATATVTLSSQGRMFLSVNVDENGDGQAEEFHTITLSRVAPALPLAVTAASPLTAAPGEAIAIYGTGFCPGAQDNTLLIGGESATAHNATGVFLEFLLPETLPTGSYVSTLAMGDQTVAFPLDIDTVFSPQPIDASDQADGFIGGEILIIYEDSASPEDIAAVASTYALVAQQHFPDLGYYRAIVPGIAGTPLLDLVASLTSDSRVAVAIPNALTAPSDETVNLGNLPVWPWALGFQGIGVREAFLAGVFPRLGEGVNIVIVDSGVDSRVDVQLDTDNGAEFIELFSPTVGTDDEPGCDKHGTRVASVAASRLDLGDGASPQATGVGAAPKATVIPYTVTNEPIPFAGNCFGHVGRMKRAIRSAAHLSGPTVVNISQDTELGLVEVGGLLRDRETFWKRVFENILSKPGATPRLIVVSAPNEDVSGLEAIASAGDGPDTFAVLGVTSRRQPVCNPTCPVEREATGYGAGLDFIAPGVAVVGSTIDSEGNISTISNVGASHAAPLVSGAAALVLAEFPTLTPKEVERRLVDLFTRPPDQDFVSTIAPNSPAAPGDCTGYPGHCRDEFGNGSLELSHIFSASEPYRLFDRPPDDTESGTYTKVHKTGTWVNYGEKEIVRLWGPNSGDRSCVQNGTFRYAVRGPGVRDVTGWTDLKHEVNGDGCLYPGDPEADITEKFYMGPGVYRVGLSLEPGIGGATADDLWIETLPCGIFCDYFDVADGPIGNAWSQLTGATHDVVVVNGQAEPSIPCTSWYEDAVVGLTRPLPALAPGEAYSISANVYPTPRIWGGGTYAGYYNHFLTVWDDGAGNGYGVQVDRGIPNYNTDVSIILRDNGQLIEWHAFPNQRLRGPPLPVRFTVDEAGSLSVTILAGAGFPEESFSFATPVSINSTGSNFTWRTIVPPVRCTPTCCPDTRPNVDNLTVDVVTP